MRESMIAKTHLLDRECVRVGLHQHGPLPVLNAVTQSHDTNTQRAP